jgi:hypothetical protein
MANLTAAHVMPFLGCMPLNIRADLERDFYPVLLDELTEVLDGRVFEQLPVAHGSTLKIDFHVGDPQGHGVGIEVKMPKNNADIQRTLGQLDQYQRRYGGHLLLFVIQEFLKPEIVHLAQDALKARGVRRSVDAAISASRPRPAPCTCIPCRGRRPCARRRGP